VACLAQFWPGKYPDTFWVLAGCVTSYTALSFAVTAVGVWLEHDTIVLTKQRPGRRALALSSSMPRFQENYALAVRPRGSPAGGTDEVKLQKSVGAYFDTDGVLHPEVIEADVAALLERVAGGRPKAN
jgi:signal peptidase complex subunit 2